ncbi:MAG: ATP-dependent DNA helicase RecG, partial [Actinomycetes bacterium]
GLLARFDAGLPFQMTAGQREVSQVILRDLQSGHPMHRLLQGEVGSGKTLVALRAMLEVVDSGGQAALLAPTEVLAAQHFRTICELMGPLATGGMLGGDGSGTQVALLTGSQTVGQRRAALLKVVSGEAGIVVGTHAILQDKVQFADLGMIVVDEQHRFGVEQRAALSIKTQGDTRAHVLVMTATPIPRTVAMTVFGDLEVSTLRELPAGRSPIQTHLVPAIDKPAFLSRTWDRVREEVEAGGQAYVVCPRIDQDPDEELEAALAQFLGVEEETAGDDQGADAAVSAPLASVEGTLAELTRGPLAGLRLAQLTGRMSGEEKDTVMRRFAGDRDRPDAIDVLVATTVIEVGVDVPNATVMVVMDADRFGISQLHQLRGRVGRGSKPGLCLLVTNAPAESPARQRLEAVASTTDGFELSRLDLQARREGNVLGATQAGRATSLRFLSLLRDEDIIVAARSEAATIVESDPLLVQHQALRRAAAELVGEDGGQWLERT